MQVKILLLGDMHVGSVHGLWHPEFITKQGITIGLNTVQKTLWDYWCKAVEEIKRNVKPRWIVAMGDLIDGVQPAEAGRTLVSTDLDDQIGCAEKLLRMLPTNKIFFVVGTDYHENRYSQMHYQLCRFITGDDYYWLDTMGYIVHSGYNLNFAHGSSAAFVYPESVMARERMFMLSAAELRKIDKPCDLVARGHLHIYSMLESSGFRMRTYPGLKAPAVTSIKVLICPAWQGQTGYMRKRSPFKLIPDIGYVTVILDDYGVHVKERIFPHIGIEVISRAPSQRREKDKVEPSKSSPNSNSKGENKGNKKEIEGGERKDEG